MPLARRANRHTSRMHRVQRTIENEMQCRCVVTTQPTRTRTGDTSTVVAGSRVWPALPEVDGPCKVALDTRSETFHVQGHQKRTFRGYVITLPVSTGKAIQPNQVITITESENPYLAGKSLVIASVVGETAEGGRKLLAIDNQG